MSTNGRADYCKTIKVTQGVHPRKLKLIKQKVNQDAIYELSSEDEKNFALKKKKRFWQLKASFYNSLSSLQ